MVVLAYNPSIQGAEAGGSYTQDQLVLLKYTETHNLRTIKSNTSKLIG